MKDHHLRQDKTCLNCGATVQDRYCSHCGQENTVPKESFRHLIGHFFADVTHYDSQVFTSLKDLIIKPGFLTIEYNAGRRVSYLNPIRMYVFISAIFFLVMFSQKNEEDAGNNVTATKTAVNSFRQHMADSLKEMVKSKRPLSVKDSISNGLYASLAAHLDTPRSPADTEISINASVNDNGFIAFRIRENKYTSIGEYETEQRKLPGSARDGMIARYVGRKLIRLTHEKRHGGELVIAQNVEHDIPKIMFVLLPLFALFVSFFYSRKKFFYSQHAIFSLHFHSFVFIAFLLAGLVSLALPMDKAWFILAGVTFFTIFIYLAFALHNAYKEALWLSLIKAMVISISYIITLIVCILIVFAGVFILL
jgi:hypothetical protein